MQIETEAGSDDESDESDSEVNGEIELSKVTEMRIIPSDPGQRILFVLDSLLKVFVSFRTMSFMPDALILGFIVAAFFLAEKYMYSFSFKYYSRKFLCILVTVMDSACTLPF